jgi:predicted Rossmann fold nucleotide-binding protein DprA/Smf involved in DNA uptake
MSTIGQELLNELNARRLRFAAAKQAFDELPPPEKREFLAMLLETEEFRPRAPETIPAPPPVHDPRTSKTNAQRVRDALRDGPLSAKQIAERAGLPTDKVQVMVATTAGVRRHGKKSERPALYELY